MSDCGKMKGTKLISGPAHGSLIDFRSEPLELQSCVPGKSTSDRPNTFEHAWRSAYLVIGTIEFLLARITGSYVSKVISLLHQPITFFVGHEIVQGKDPRTLLGGCLFFLSRIGFGKHRHTKLLIVFIGRDTFKQFV